MANKTTMPVSPLLDFGPFGRRPSVGRGRGEATEAGRYFSIPELTESLTAKACSIANVPTSEEVNNLVRLVGDVLDPLRERWGVPIYVNSGYRCEALNRKVGGSKNSYHLRGMAADITSRCPFHNTALYTEIRIMHREGLLPLTECYLSRQGTYIHLAYDKDNVKPNPFLASPVPSQPKVDARRGQSQGGVTR